MNLISQIKHFALTRSEVVPQNVSSFLVRYTPNRKKDLSNSQNSPSFMLMYVSMHLPGGFLHVLLPLQLPGLCRRMIRPMPRRSTATPYTVNDHMASYLFFNRRYTSSFMVKYSIVMFGLGWRICIQCQLTSGSTPTMFVFPIFMIYPSKVYKFFISKIYL